MTTTPSWRRALFALGLALSLSRCALNTPAPRFAPTSPAEPGGEGAVAPPRPLLTGEGELAERPAEDSARAVSGSAPASDRPSQGHAGHGMADQTPAATGEEAVYSCLMHPEVKEKAPGKCPICGMTLVKKGPKR